MRKSFDVFFASVIVLIYIQLPMLSCFKLPFGIRRLSVKSMSSFSLPVVELLPGKEKKFIDGNPIVYDGAVKSVKGSPQAGDEVYVADSNRQIFGRGLYNPNSMYRIRLSALDTESEFNMPLDELLHSRIDRAIDKRASINLPSRSTNVYRLINGEGDKISGLAVDVLGNTMIAQPSALWIEKHSSLVKKVLNTYADANKMSLVWRRQLTHLKLDGFNESTAGNDSVVNALNRNNEIVIENGIKYAVDAASDQKTGFYCDQRENRFLLRSYCRDKNVLDLYCYTGGFALNSIAGGAKSVLAVDSSNRAIACAEKNRLLNGIESSKLEFREGDCEAVMKSLVGSHFFDVIICDPPKLAPSRTALQPAYRKYRHLNTLAMQLIEPTGGILLTCSCSAAMTQSGRFLAVLREAADIAGRKVSVLKVLEAGEDHPVLPAYPEGKYLTAVLLKVE